MELVGLKGEFLYFNEDTETASAQLHQLSLPTHSNQPSMVLASCNFCQTPRVCFVVLSDEPDNLEAIFEHECDNSSSEENCLTARMWTAVHKQNIKL